MSKLDIWKDRIDGFRVDSASISSCADALRRLGYRICSFENVPTHFALDLMDTTLEEILNEIIRKNPGYRWAKVENSDLINIFPNESILDSKMPTLNIQDKGLWEIIEEDFGLEQKGILLFQGLHEVGYPTIDLVLKDHNLRECLNEIVRRFSAAVWHISGNPGAYTLTITDIEGR